MFDFGTFAHHVVVDRDQVIQTPDHVDDIHAAAWPLGAVTAWRYIYHHASLDAERQLLAILFARVLAGQQSSTGP